MQKNHILQYLIISKHIRIFLFTEVKFNYKIGMFCVLGHRKAVGSGKSFVKDYMKKRNIILALVVS